jgi:hypothetical protein
MRVLKLRKRLQAQGFQLTQHSCGFHVEGGPIKQPFSRQFKSLKEVEIWFAGQMQHNNRLTEDECDEWDEQWKRFVEEQK